MNISVKQISAVILLASAAFAVQAQVSVQSDFEQPNDVEEQSEGPVFSGVGSDDSFEMHVIRDDLVAEWEADARAAGLDPATATATAEASGNL